MSDDKELAKAGCGCLMFIILVVPMFLLERWIHWELAYKHDVEGVVAPMRDKIQKLETRIEDLEK
jgi:hypothetical protein